MPDLFTNNPVVMSLSNALGLGSITGEAAAIDAAQKGATAPAPAKSAQTVPAYRNRPYLPPGQHGGVGPGAITPAQPTPGTLDPAILQNPDVQKMLGVYGVDPSTVHPDPNLFIHNPDAFKNHPVLSNVIERGLEGIAAYTPGRDAAESIGNVVRSVTGANALRAEQVNNQVMAPFQQAAQVANLQHLGLQNEQVQHQMDYQDGMLDLANQREQDLNEYHQSVEGYKQSAIDARAEAQAAKLDPEIHGKQLFYQAKTAELIKQYGSEQAVPSAEWQKMATAWESSKDHALDARAGAKNATTIAAAGIRASRASGSKAPKYNPNTDENYLAIGRQQTAIQNQIKMLSKSGTMVQDPENPNRTLVTGTPRATQLVQKLQQQHIDLQAQRDYLKSHKGVQPSGSPPPAQSSGNKNPYVH